MSFLTNQSTGLSGTSGTFGFGTSGSLVGASNASTSSSAMPGLSFGAPLASATTAAGGPTSGLSFGAPLNAATTTVAGTTMGFSFGAPTAAAGTSLGLSGSTPQTTDSQQQRSVRFDVPSLGVTTPASSTSATPSLSALLGGNTAAASTTTSTPTAGTSFGLGLAQPSSGAFGIGATTSATATTSTATSGGLFGISVTSAAPTTSSQGLGGVASASGSATVGANKNCDAKAVKELPVPSEIVTTVEEFTKHVKTQKGVRENIARMSSKPLYRVQEDMKNLSQQLLLVTGGLQRNAVAIDKLKRETAQELKHAEIAQRTKDTPPGLQYENTAPTEYFQRLADEFEVQMQLYRQQIAELENHLESADLAATFTPQELSVLLGKLNEGFIALAAQLQIVHEAVKEQKEGYMAYRRSVYGDSSDIFDRRQKTSASCKTVSSFTPPTTVGPTPFALMSSAAATAMAAVLNRTQSATNTGFGLACGGSTSLGTGTQTSALGSSFFGQTATGQSFGLTNLPRFRASVPSTTQSSSFACGSFGTTGQSTSGGLFGPSPTTQTAFPTPKTPIGSKRGKVAT